MELGQVVDIDEHQHKEQQHHNRAGVDDDLNHRQILGAEHDENARDLNEADHQEDGGVHRVAWRPPFPSGGKNGQAPDEQENQRLPGH